MFKLFSAFAASALIFALAGPAANVLIALAGTLIAAVAPPEGVARLLLDILVYANWLVALFNVLPGLPLDGGRIVESAVWAATGSQDKGTVAAGWSGRGIVLLLAVLLVVVPFLQGRPADIPLIVILVMVGFFLWNGASEAIRVGRLRQVKESSAEPRRNAVIARRSEASSGSVSAPASSASDCPSASASCVPP